MSPAWEPCNSCSGSGLQDSLTGVEDCWWCKGEGVVRVRDSKGRYAVTTAANSDPETKLEVQKNATRKEWQNHGE